MRLGLACAVLLLAATSASQAQADAPPARSPEQRQRVVDLAYVLGEAHALHRLCAGTDDNTWRGRMSRLIQVEAPDPAYRQRLMGSFNAGFTARSVEFHSCTNKSAAAEREAAERGRSLSRQLAAATTP
jgi:uncharacterized protein (TIGR02301 family)